MGMKTLALVASLVCAQAFAASPQLQQLSRTQVGARIMQELGVSVTTADLSAALTAKYGAQQASVILAAITQFNTQAAGSQNADGLARSIFHVNQSGQFNVAALSGSNRSGMIQAAAPAGGESCSVDGFASELAKDTRIPFPVAKEAVIKILNSGNCKGGAANYNANARGNLLEMAEYGMNHGADKVTGAARDQILAAGLAVAKNNDGLVQTTAAAELTTIASLRTNCALIK